MARTTISIARHADRLPGWWVSARVEWGAGSCVAGLARSIPFRTRRAARAWVDEQFPNAVVSKL